MKFDKNKKYITIGFILAIFLLGCSEDILEEKPPHLITTETLYKSLEGFENGINGLYATLRLEREGWQAVNHMRAEIFMNGTDNLLTNHASGEHSSMVVKWGTLNNPNRTYNRVIFLWLYEIVNASNTIINRAESANINWAGNGKTADENKNRIVAEARAMRALAYRHLAYLWGDVPISLEESSGSNIKTDWARESVSKVWNQVEADLLFAEQHIEIDPSVEGKITKGAIQHFLSELYLVKGNAQSALDYANKVIDNPAYSLITSRYGVRASQPGVPFMDMFYDGNSNRSEGNTESLWTWQWELETVGGGSNIMRRWHISRYNDIKIGGVTPLELTVERGGRPRARMGLTPYAINLYEEGDDRGTNYVLRRFFVLKDEKQNDTGVADVLPDGYNYGDTIWTKWDSPITATSRSKKDWPYVRKWDWGNPAHITGGDQFNDQVYLRLAETYLLKAEAQHLLGDNAGAAATINIVRSRSNASPIAEGDVSIDYILDERSRELVVEEHRRYTLLRTGKWLERVQAYNTQCGDVVTERDKLYPIPQSVIDANLTSPMPQNPGY